MQQFRELYAALGVLIGHLNRIEMPHFISDLKAIEQQIVLTVGVNSPSIKMLCEHFQINSSTMTGIIGRMEEEEIVMRESCKSDRRVVLVSLTKKWRRKYQDFKRRQKQSARLVYESISQERFDSLMELISETNEILKR